MIQKVTKRGRGGKVWGDGQLTQWIGLFAVKAGGASLNLHVCQEAQEAL